MVKKNLFEFTPFIFILINFKLNLIYLGINYF